MTSEQLRQTLGRLSDSKHVIDVINIVYQIIVLLNYVRSIAISESLTFLHFRYEGKSIFRTQLTETST